MSMLQVILTFIACILFVIAPFFDYNQYETTFLYTVVVQIGLACLLASIITFVVFLVRHKSERTKLLIPGIRNLLLIPSALLVSRVHSTSWTYNAGDTAVKRYDYWETEYLCYALALVAIVFIVFSLIELLIQKKKK